MKLYLYCKFEDAKTILDVKYLRVSIPNRMNDPFELLAQTEMEVRRKDYDREMEVSRIRKIFYWNLKNAGYEKSYAKFQKEMAKDPDFFFDIYKNELPKSYRELVQGYLEFVSKKFGFICLSKNYSSILMWSHYSHKHTGVVFGFESKKMKLEQKHLSFVDYDEKRIRITPTIDPEHEQNGKEFEKLIRRKHIDWKYEEEVRIIAGLTDMNDKGEYALDFPAEALEDIYFGWKCDREREIIELCKLKGFTSNFFKMQPHPNSFTLVPFPVEADKK